MNKQLPKVSDKEISNFLKDFQNKKMKLLEEISEKIRKENPTLCELIENAGNYAATEEQHLFYMMGAYHTYELLRRSLLK